jgi:hypothetical protein
MRNALASKLDRLEAELSPQPRLKVVFAGTDKEVEELSANSSGQGDICIVTWLPTADDAATIGG